MVEDLGTKVKAKGDVTECSLVQRQILGCPQVAAWQGGISTDSVPPRNASRTKRKHFHRVQPSVSRRMFLYTTCNPAELSSDLNALANIGAATVITDYIKNPVKANSQLPGKPFIHY